MNAESSHEIIEKLNFCVIDLETTGGNHGKDKIIEVGMVKLVGTKITETKSFLINPEMQIPDFIQKLTGISQKSVKNAEIIENLIDEIVEFIDDDILVAHNTSFDVPFLNGTLRKLDRPELENRVICTNVMTKHLIPEILNSNLNYLSRLFKIDHTKAHRAEDDALATAKLLVIYLNIFKDKGLKKVNQLYYPRNKFELDRIHFDTSHSITDILALVKNQESSVLITAKGERGLILATLPIENPKEEAAFVESILNKVDWQIITIRLVEPMIEAIFQFSNHYLKYSEEIRKEILDYLKERYIKSETDIDLDRLDFILAHHIIEDQIMTYSFLNLNTSAKALFKIPAQKKKLYQYLTSQINRFENTQKGKRKNHIHTDIVPLIQSFLQIEKDKQSYLYLDRKEVKKDKEVTMDIIEDFVEKFNNPSKFPTTHL